MLKTDSDHAGVGFTKEGIRNCSGKPDHKNWYQQGQNYKAKSNGNMKRQTQQKNQHQQGDRGRHASKAGYHQTRPTLRKGGGDGRRKDGKQVSKALGCACQHRYYPSSACYLLKVE